MKRVLIIQAQCPIYFKFDLIVQQPNQPLEELEAHPIEKDINNHHNMLFLITKNVVQIQDMHMHVKFINRVVLKFQMKKTEQSKE